MAKWGEPGSKPVLWKVAKQQLSEVQRITCAWQTEKKVSKEGRQLRTYLQLHPSGDNNRPERQRMWADGGEHDRGDVWMDH